MKLFLKSIFAVAAVFAVVSCDKDFNEVGADIIGGDHFDFDLYEGASIVANTVPTGAVQSNNLDVNPFGIYENPALGTTTANFVTQLELASVNPTFNTINGGPVIDSVILSIPYNSTRLSVEDDGERIYQLNSIYGPNNGTTAPRMKLGVYESNYFLRDLDHNDQGGQEVQRYYTDQTADIDGAKNPLQLNDSDLSQENDQFFFDKTEVHEKTVEDDGDVKLERLVPALRLHLNKEFFTEKILNAPAGALQNNNAFKNYFRGLFFNIESLGDGGQMALMNFKGGTVKIYYRMHRAVTNNTPSTEDDAVEDDYTLTLNMTGNTISLVNHTPSPSYLAGISQPFSPTTGHDLLFLKGGQGSVATIDLFGDTDADNNGTPDELDYIKAQNWMINEASLTFFIDNTSTGMGTGTVKPSEPDRVYLYNLTNKTPVIDYYYDTSTGSAGIKRQHGGIIEKDESDRGTQYKIRITEYVKSLIKNDSTNVRLGLSVTQTITNIAMNKQRLPNATSETLNEFVPAASVMNPLGTILYGTGPSVPEDKRLKLKIYYTKPN